MEGSLSKIQLPLQIYTAFKTYVMALPYMQVRASPYLDK